MGFILFYFQVDLQTVSHTFLFWFLGCRARLLAALSSLADQIEFWSCRSERSTHSKWVLDGHCAITTNLQPPVYPTGSAILLIV